MLARTWGRSSIATASASRASQGFARQDIADLKVVYVQDLIKVSIKNSKSLCDSLFAFAAVGKWLRGRGSAKTASRPRLIKQN